MQGKDFSHPLEMTTPVISNELRSFSSPFSKEIINKQLSAGISKQTWGSRAKTQRPQRKLYCHFDSFGRAQDKLREKIFLRFGPLARGDSS